MLRWKIFFVKYENLTKLKTYVNWIIFPILNVSTFFNSFIETSYTYSSYKYSINTTNITLLITIDISTQMNKKKKYHGHNNNT